MASTTLSINHGSCSLLRPATAAPATMRLAAQVRAGSSAFRLVVTATANNNHASSSITSDSQSDDVVLTAESSAARFQRRHMAAAALAVVAASLAGVADVEPAVAAYGEAANVFGKAKTDTSFIPLSSPSGFALSVPAKWRPSRELGEFPNVVVRFEDNFDATNNLVVIKQPSDKSSIAGFGSPAAFIEEFKFLLGVQSFTGETASEGGFEKNTILTASVLEAEEIQKGGTDYYRVHVLTRTADGDEGGKHQLFTAAVSGGNLYILKVQAGDKRWFKGAKKFVEGAVDSFSVA